MAEFKVDPNIQSGVNATDDIAALISALKSQAEMWNDVVEKLDNFKTLEELIELQCVVYSKRQDLCSSIMSMSFRISRETDVYNASVNNMIASYMKNNIQKDYARLRDMAKNDLYHMKTKIDVLIAYKDYLTDTLSTLDNMIYGINNRIRLHESINNISK